MSNLPLCHWPSQLFDLGVPLSTDVPVLLLKQPIKNAIAQLFQRNPTVKSLSLGKLVFFLQVYDKNDEIWVPNKEWYYTFIVIHSKYFSNPDWHRFPWLILHIQVTIDQILKEFVISNETTSVVQDITRKKPMQWKSSGDKVVLALLFW